MMSDMIRVYNCDNEVIYHHIRYFIITQPYWYVLPIYSGEYPIVYSVDGENLINV